MLPSASSAMAFTRPSVLGSNPSLAFWPKAAAGHRAASVRIEQRRSTDVPTQWLAGGSVGGTAGSGTCAKMRPSTERKDSDFINEQRNLAPPIARHQS